MLTHAVMTIGSKFVTVVTPAEIASLGVYALLLTHRYISRAFVDVCKSKTF